jgi:hypothetical protein
MSFLDNRLPLKSYNQTTTKRCHICESCDIYESVSAEIGYSCEIAGIWGSFRKPMLYPTELRARQSPKCLQYSRL